MEDLALSIWRNENPHPSLRKERTVCLSQMTEPSWLKWIGQKNQTLGWFPLDSSFTKTSHTHSLPSTHIYGHISRCRKIMKFEIFLNRIFKKNWMQNQIYTTEVNIQTICYFFILEKFLVSISVYEMGKYLY